MRRVHAFFPSLCLLILHAVPVMAANPQDDVFDLDNLRVKITPQLPYMVVKHEGKPVTLMRHQDIEHSVEAPFHLTARDCPPFCVQPMSLHSAVETIGELELMEFLKRVSNGDESVLVVDSRTPDFVEAGSIPGAMNIPYTQLLPEQTKPQDIAELLQFEFNAGFNDGLWDFSAAKTLVMFCNGPWCGQSPTNIKALLKLGYPPERIKWYRGGMQAWEQFGLTTVKPEKTD